MQEELILKVEAERELPLITRYEGSDKLPWPSFGGLTQLVHKMKPFLNKADLVTVPRP